MSIELLKNATVALDPNLVKQVTEAFLIFDSQNNGALDVREVGTILRSLGKFILHYSKLSS